jgi:hypothetical protein
MTQEERDRLVTLKKAEKKLIKQQAAAEELGVNMRQVRRLLLQLKEEGDQSVIHGWKVKPWHRRMEEEAERESVKVVSAPI